MPTGGIEFKENFVDTRDFMEQFGDIPVGSTLYGLRGHQNPDDQEGIYMGEIVTTDNCASSSYFGDTKLFFKHQYITEDVALRPEWADAYNSY